MTTELFPLLPETQRRLEAWLATDIEGRMCRVDLTSPCIVWTEDDQLDHVEWSFTVELSWNTYLGDAMVLSGATVSAEGETLDAAMQYALHHVEAL